MEQSDPGRNCLSEAPWPERARLGPGEGFKGDWRREKISQMLSRGAGLSAGGPWRVGHMGERELSLSSRCFGGHGRLTEGHYGWRPE